LTVKFSITAGDLLFASSTGESETSDGSKNDDGKRGRGGGVKK
jgi:hypothetical protein